MSAELRIVMAPTRDRKNIVHRWKDKDRGKARCSEKKKLMATSSTTNPIAPEHNQGLRGEKPATDLQGHCSSLATNITNT